MSMLTESHILKSAKMEKAKNGEKKVQKVCYSRSV